MASLELERGGSVGGSGRLHHAWYGTRQFTPCEWAACKGHFQTEFSSCSCAWICSPLGWGAAGGVESGEASGLVGRRDVADGVGEAVLAVSAALAVKGEGVTKNG